jgi:hypothetical protein
MSFPEHPHLVKRSSFFNSADELLADSSDGSRDNFNHKCLKFLAPVSTPEEIANVGQMLIARLK